MQLLAAMRLRGSGTGLGQATAVQAAAWLRMGPMGPRGLGPWALWAPGALGPTPFRLCRRALRGFFFGKKGV